MIKDYWKKTHEIYGKKDWISNTTMFAQFAVRYFPKKGKLLDLGAGQGQDLRYFAKLGYDVVSTDISDSALKISKDNADKEGLSIKFIEVDIANKLPFEDNSFDIVYSHLALHYFTDEKTREIFQEIFRVLKPQGILASLFNTIEDSETIDPNYKLVEKDYYKSPEGLLKRYFSVDYLKDVAGELFTPVILDNSGETYKDEIKTLIRFVGKANK
jgi:ubiquinone/menaquinone biosynthesis C-methylase UbiE